MLKRQSVSAVCDLIKLYTSNNDTWKKYAKYIQICQNVAQHVKICNNAINNM